MNAFDTAEDTTGHAHLIAAAGIGAVGLYLRPDRASPSMAEGLHSVGVKLFSIWEKGEPIDPSYFTAAQGLADAEEACAFAVSIGQPSGTTVSPAVDYDSNPADVQAYLIAFHDFCRTYGYYCLPYGNGVTLQWAIEAGYAVGGYLSQSQGFDGYEEFLSKAAIVQGESTVICGFEVDLDTIVLEKIGDVSTTW